MEQSPEREAEARAILMGTHPNLRWGRRIFAHLPSEPRCKMCANPFGGVGGFVARRIGKAPWPKNPKFCSDCFTNLTKQHMGAEIECSLLFADVRDSTGLAESMRPTEFHALMNRFFEASSHVLVRYDAIVDKFVGDEVMAIFIPALAGENHAGRAVDAGRALIAESIGSVPVGAGVHTETAYVGTVGEGDQVDLTAMGDAVNVAARLASAAGAGELLVTDAAARAAGLAGDDIEHRTLELKGKSQPTEVLVIRPAA